MTVTAKLDKNAYDPGEKMTLTVTEDYTGKRTMKVVDSSGVAFTKVSGTDKGQGAQFTGTAGKAEVATRTVTVTMTPSSGSAQTGKASYTVGPQTSEPEPGPGPEPDTDLTIIGMSSPNKDWSTRLSQVGPAGITARRIFINPLDSAGNAQSSIIKNAFDTNLMPVISFKVPSPSSPAQYDSYVDNLCKKVQAYGKPATITFAHEPNPDMTGAVFVAANKRWAPIVHRYSNLKFGPFLNGWLLDNKVDTFTSYSDKSLLAGGNGGWDFMGIDTYESGTINTPGKIKPADRIPKLVNWLKAQGYPNKLIGIGEYNGYSGASIAAAGEAILSTPTVWFGMMWNATTGKGYVLEGERLLAFKKTKADPRVRR